MHILLAEDEHQLSHVVVMALTSQGYSVDPVYNGQEAVDYAKQHAYDLMILDIMMPVKTGLEALREIRATGDRTYVMMLTAMAEVDDKVNGLDAGADDYLTKPFSLKELLARVRSLDRRNGSLDRYVLTFADLTLDDNEQTLSAHNSISLTNKETRLLQYMILNANKQLTVADLLNHTWDDDDESADEEDVWFTISYVRQKMKSVNAHAVIEGEKGGPFILTNQ